MDVRREYLYSYPMTENRRLGSVLKGTAVGWVSLRGSSIWKEG